MLRVLPPSFKPVNNLICCNAGLIWVENAQHRYSSSFAASCKTSCTFFVARFSVPLGGVAG